MKQKVLTKFTLIELLVVVAILGILASLLLPSLGKARKRALEATCLNNQRQMGIAAFNYADDHEYFPTTGNQELSWRHKIFPYLGGDINRIAVAYENGGIFRCVMSEYTFNSEHNNTGIGYNRIYFGNDSVTEGDGSLKYPPVLLNDVEKPTETILIGDSMDDTESFGFADKLEPPSKSGQGARSDPVIGYRHRGGINSLWVDGHAKRYGQAYLMAGKNGKADYYFMTNKPD